MAKGDVKPKASRLNSMTRVVCGLELTWANSCNKGYRCTKCGAITHQKGYDK